MPTYRNTSAPGLELFVNLPEEMHGAEQYARARDEHERCLGYVTQATRQVALVQEPITKAAMVETETTAPAWDLSFQTEDVLMLDVVVPLWPRPTSYGAPWQIAPWQIEGSGYVATNYYTTAANYSTDLTWTRWQALTGTSTADGVWQAWYGNATSTATSTVTFQQVSGMWNDWIVSGNDAGLPSLAEETEEQRAAREAAAAESLRVYQERQEENRRVAAERRAHREAAHARAQELLAECLSEEQAVEYEANRYFTVRSPDGERGFRTFRVHHGYQGNVVELNEEGRNIGRYCIHPRDVPEEDTMVAQKLMLETDPDSFMAIANFSRS